MGGDATAVETGNLPALRRRKPSSRGCREFAGLLESRVGVLRKGAVSRGRREASELKHIASMLRSAGPDGSVSSVWICGSVSDALHESRHVEPVSWQRLGGFYCSNHEATVMPPGSWMCSARSEEHTSELL